MKDIAPEALQAVAIGLYALHDALVEQGILEPGQTAAMLRSVGPATPDDGPALLPLMAYLHEVAANLEGGVFRFKPAANPESSSALRVITGGKP